MAVSIKAIIITPKRPISKGLSADIPSTTINTNISRIIVPIGTSRTQAAAAGERKACLIEHLCDISWI